MNILGKIWNGFCWLWVGLFLLGVPSGILMYFTEPDVTFFESIGVAIFCIPLAWMFYAIGPKNSRDKRIEEMKAIAEETSFAYYECARVNAVIKGSKIVSIIEEIEVIE